MPSLDLPKCLLLSQNFISALEQHITTSWTVIGQSDLTGNVQDVLSEMATIAPMLVTLGYNPNDTHPSYEKVPLLVFLKVFDLSESESV